MSTKYKEVQDRVKAFDTYNKDIPECLRKHLQLKESYISNLRSTNEEERKKAQQNLNDYAEFNHELGSACEQQYENIAWSKIDAIKDEIEGAYQKIKDLHVEYNGKDKMQNFASKLKNMYSELIPQLEESANYLKNQLEIFKGWKKDE